MTPHPVESKSSENDRIQEAVDQSLDIPKAETTCRSKRIPLRQNTNIKVIPNPQPYLVEAPDDTHPKNDNAATELSVADLARLQKNMEEYQRAVVAAVEKLLRLAEPEKKIDYQTSKGRLAINPRKWIVENLMGTEKLSPIDIALIPLNAYKHYDVRLHASLGQERHFNLKSSTRTAAEKIVERTITLDMTDVLDVDTASSRKLRPKKAA
jgi:hypothetical protein